MSARGAPPQCPEAAFLRSSWDDGLRVALLRHGVWGPGEGGPRRAALALSGAVGHWQTGCQIRRAAALRMPVGCFRGFVAPWGSLRLAYCAPGSVRGDGDFFRVAEPTASMPSGTASTASASALRCTVAHSGTPAPPVCVYRVPCRTAHTHYTAGCQARRRAALEIDRCDSGRGTGMVSLAHFVLGALGRKAVTNVIHKKRKRERTENRIGRISVTDCLADCHC